MESNRIQDKKNYAVVRFVSDNTFSEIPTAWLSEENDVLQCWWPPRNANSAILIANFAIPNHNTWSKYVVELIKYCCKYLHIIHIMLLFLYQKYIFVEYKIIYLIKYNFLRLY